MAAEGSSGYPGGAYPADDSPSGGMSISQMLRAIRKRWWLPPLCGAVALGAAWYLVPHNFTIYNASTVIRLDNAAQVLGSMPATNTRSPEFMLSQVHVISSREVLGPVVDSLDLRLSVQGVSKDFLRDVTIDGEDAVGIDLRFAQNGFVATAGRDSLRAAYGQPVKIAGVGFTVAQAPSVPAARIGIRPREMTIAEVGTAVLAAPRDGAAIIDIKYISGDPNQARIVVNEIARSYRSHNVQEVLASVRKRRDFALEQVRAAEAAVAQAQAALNEFRRRGTGASPGDQLRVEQTELLRLDGQREELRSQLESHQLFLSRVQRAGADQIDEELRTLITVSGNASSPLLSQLFTRFVNYQVEREQLLASGLATTNPSVTRLTTLIDSTRSSVVGAARTQIASLQRRISALDTQRARNRSALQALPASESDESRLLQEVESAQSLAAELRGDYREALLAEAMDVGQVAILDSATFADSDVTGGRNQKLAFALGFGLILGCCGSVLLEARNSSIRWGGDAEAQLSVPALGAIPSISPNGKAGARGSKKGKDRAEASTSYAAGAEAYRRLRTNLVFLKPFDELRTMAVTSSTSGEGKTTTAANLAVAFARQGRRVLLVDCDLRRPRLHTVFGVSSSPGFTDLLLGRATQAEAIVNTAEERLHFLPRGNFDERAVELLSGWGMQELVEGLKENFDLVMFDTSPVLLTADAAAVAAMADGVLLVVRAGTTPRDAVRSTGQQLEAIGANVLGFVLNDPDAVAEEYGEYSYSEAYTAQV